MFLNLRLGGAVFVIFVAYTVFFSFIFWLLTAICKFFYFDKSSSYKLNFYECGFPTLVVVKVYVPAQFLLAGLFLLIYDGEFVLLYPAVFNLFFLSSFQFYILFLFLFLLVAALIVDYLLSALDWHL